MDEWGDTGEMQMTDKNGTPQKWYTPAQHGKDIKATSMQIVSSESDHATTSAELKLLRLRRTLLSPGRADFVAGTTTADALFVIQASDVVPARLTVAFATSLKDDVWVGCGLFGGINVGSLDGTGEGGGKGRRVDIGRKCWDVESEWAAEAAAAALAADIFRVLASLGILLGPCPTDFTGEAGVVAPAPALRIASAPAVDLVTRVGRCSDDVTPRAVAGCDTFNLVRAGASRNVGSTSSDSSSSESRATRLVRGVFRG